ncbi:MAG: ATP-binding protein [Lachnospiraceae bacterium]|nr:ATP-binding protein [Lachnospiraceae bacterium]MEE1342006.1 ATP-binding protein [Lachnospiraceae bacterium]
MLKYFSVQNFKCFHDKVEFDFSDVRDYHFNEQCVKDKLLHNAIIYGKNASGKTNLGYALFDITYHMVDKNKVPSVYKNYCNADCEQDYAEFSYEFVFNNDTVCYKYKKKEVGVLLYESLYLNGMRLFEYDFENHIGDFTGIQEKVTDTLRFDEKFDISLVRYIVNNTILAEDSPIKKMVKFVSNMLWFRSLVGNNLYMGYQIGEKTITEYLIKNYLVADFEEFLHECGIEETLVTQKDPSGEEIIYIKRKKLLPFIDVASSGTIALAMFYIWFHEAEHISFLWIDEFDAFYHYELAEKVVQLLEEKIQCQSVLTSHNTNLLSNKIMRPDCYFILAHGKLTSIVNATPRELREGHNLEKLFKNGEFDV